MRRYVRPTVFLLFFISGISALVYEVVWTRMLVMVFGNTVFAVSTVLAAFMTGLAIGSISFGRLVDRRGHPLRTYALLELGIAVSAILLTAVLWRVNTLCVWLQQSVSDSAVLLTLVRYAVSFSLLVVPTTLMGGTLPVLSKFIVGHRSSLGRRVGALYALNTLGAAAGCYAAGFLLIGRIGLDWSVWTAAFLNLCVGSLAWWLGSRVASHAKPRRVFLPGAQVNPKVGEAKVGQILGALVLGTMALSGFAALGYEVVWTRLLTFVLGNSVYAFATMLTTFLVGLGLGSMLCSRLVDRGKRLVAALGMVQAGIGIYGIVCVQLFGRLLGSAGPMSFYASGDWAAAAGSSFFRALRIMFIPTLLMGASFPLAVRIYAANISKLGQRIGKVYSFNTVGAILGSTVTGFVFIPLLGLQNSMIGLGLINVALGLTLGAAEPRMSRAARTILLGAISGALILAFWTTPSDTFRRALEKGTSFVYYKEDVSCTVWIEEAAPDRTLLVDGREMAGTYLRKFSSQKMLGHLPMLLHPNPRSVFVLGFGAGGTCYSMSTHPELKRIDSAEFCPAVIQAAELLPDINHRILRDPRLHLVINDGRNFLVTTRRRYDVISVDLLYPDSAGTGSLYTREFYQLCSRRLEDDGIMVEWIPPHLLSMRDVKVILRTCQSVFPHTALWHTPYYGSLLMIASKKAFAIDFQKLQQRMDYPSVKKDLSQVHIANPYTLVSCFVAADETLASYAQDVSLVNTDAHPFIEYSAPRARTEDVKIYQSLLDIQQPILPHLVNLGQTEEEQDQVRARLSASLESMRFVQHAVIAMRKGGLSAARDHCSKALKLDSDNEVARDLLAEFSHLLGAGRQ